MRNLAAITLRNTRPPAAVEPLISALVDENEHIRISSIETLGLLKDARFGEPPVGALKDTSSPVRKTAIAALMRLGPGSAEALGKINDPRAAGPLTALLEDPDAHVRTYAVAVLARLSGRGK